MIETNRRSFIAGALAAPFAGGYALASNDKKLFALDLVQNHPPFTAGESVFLWGVPQALGWFEEEGLDLGLKGVAGATPALQAIVSSSSALATIAPDILMLSREQGADVFSIFIHKTRSGWMLGVPPGSNIKTLADFKGKRIGVSGLGSGVVNVLHSSLADAGLSKTDYTLIATGQGAAALTALNTNNIDALGLWEAAFADLENAGAQLRYVPLPFTSQLAGLPICVTRKYMGEHRKELVGLLRCWSKAIVFAKANPEAALRLFVKAAPQAKPPNQSMDDWLAHSKRVTTAFLTNVAHETDKPFGWHNPAQWRSTHKFFVDTGVIKGTKPPEEAYTNEFIEEVNKFDVKAIQDMAAKA